MVKLAFTSLPVDMTDMVDTSENKIKNLSQLLDRAASNSHGALTFYSGDVENANRSITMTYKMLKQRAKKGAQLLHTIPNIRKETIILLHFDDHEDNIVWFWSVIEAGLLPAMSTPFVNDPVQRKKHLLHLQTLLKEPVVLTTTYFEDQFKSVENLNVVTVSSLEKKSNIQANAYNRLTITGLSKNAEDRAVLMLTSGSTGNAKAVVLRHGQLIVAMKNKIAHHEANSQDVFFNWVGFDHVASLCQIHLYALFLSATQIHAKKEDIGSNPMLFLKLIHNHRVTTTFAPNFYLDRLVQALEKTTPYSMLSLGLDLTCLKRFVSGGEANTVQTCVSATKHLHALGAKGHVIIPAFGMTETCAGSIHNDMSPEYDIKMNLEITSVGHCIPSVKMRVVNENGKPVESETVGYLQMQGEIIFQEYYNNPQATEEAFATDEDGMWFQTGDKAFIDGNGHLNLSGRAKDMIIVNGVNYYPHELESTINDAHIIGVEDSYTLVFATRPPGSQTEQIVIIYCPTFEHDDAKNLCETTDILSKITARLFGVGPYKILPLTKEMLPKSTLGKISRAKISQAFELGEYTDLHNEVTARITKYRQSQLKIPESDIEKSIAKICSDTFNKSLEDIGVNSSLLDFGVSSIDLISFKNILQKKLDISKEISLISILTNPTIGGIADVIMQLEKPKEYNPVVTLNTSGSKTPLWLVHPAAGEALVFLDLASYFSDRPLYAFRARGFEETETFFQSLEDICSTYHAHMKKMQPKGPYAIAGYSFGSVIALEISKILLDHGDEVKFLGSLDAYPHVDKRIKQMDWIDVGLDLSHLLDLLSEQQAYDISLRKHQLSAEAILDCIFDEYASKKRLEELALTKSKLEKWISLVTALNEALYEYEPSGVVTSIDVFYTKSLKFVGNDRDDCIDYSLSKWKDFSRTSPRFHNVDGSHHTMLSPQHVFSFQKILHKALRERGL